MIDENDSNDAIQRIRFQLEEICTDFEQQWRAGKKTSIEEIIATLDDQFKSGAIQELVAVELELRSEAGESPDQIDYLTRLPDYSEEIRNGFEIWRLDSQNGSADSYDFPERIGDYRIVRKLGEGGMGVVYEAVQESLDRRVAIKSLGTHPVHVPRSARRFRREARAVAMLHHTNIINVYGSGVHNGVPYFAMQLVEGRSLSQMIHEARQLKENPEESGNAAKPNPLSIMNVARIGVQIASALDYAHQQGVLHRDIKPSNLLVDEFGTTWVSDFGLAKLKNSVDATFSGDVVGTLRYVPPEATNGDWNELGDVYSLGMTLYELLALQPAFPETDHVELLDRITRGDPPVSLRRINSHVPRDLETVITKAISREPTIRYASAAELGKELQRYVDGEPIVARPASTTERVLKWSMRNPGPASLLGMILLLLTFGFPLLTLLWVRSENALESAKTARTDTEIAKIDAEVAKKVAEIARIDAEVSEYGSAMQLAQKYVEDGNMSEVQPLLEKWDLNKPSEVSFFNGRRGWEWNYLKAQMDNSRLTLNADFEYVWDVAISPDDSTIATVHACDPIQKSDGESSKVIVWDSASGELLFELPQIKDRVYSAEFSPNGMFLTTVGLDLNPDNEQRGSITVWETKTGTLVESVDLPGSFVGRDLTLHFKPILPKVSYSPDGTKILISHTPVEIRDSKTLESISQYSGYEGAFLDNSSIVVLSAKRKMRVFEIGEPEPISERTLTGRAFDLFAANYGRISVNLKNKLQVFDSDSNDGSDYEFPFTSWGGIDSNGQRLIVGSRNGEIEVIDLESRTGSQVSKKYIGHRSTVTSGTVSNRGDWLVTGSLDGTARVWDLKKDHKNYVGQTSLKHDVLADISFSKDNQQIVYVGRKRVKATSNVGSLGFYSKQKDSTLSSIETTRLARWPRTDFAFSPDGQLLAAPCERESNASDNSVGSSHCNFGVWQCKDWRKIHHFVTEWQRINSVCWSNSGKYIALAGCGTENQIKIFQVDFEGDNLNSEVCSFAVGGSVTSMSWHGNRLAVGTQNRIEVFNMGAELKNPSEFPDIVFSDQGTPTFMDFGPDGANLAVALKELGKYRVYDLSREEIRFQRTAPRDVCCVRYSPQGNRIALSGYDSLVYLCDAETGHRLLSLPGCDEPPGGYSINARVVFSSDGCRIAANNWKGEITVWEADPSVQ